MKFDHDYVPRDRASSNRPLRNLAVAALIYLIASTWAGVPL